MLNRLRALQLLSQCTGDEIWSREHCQTVGVPTAWVEELCDCYESGYLTDSQTIYVGTQSVNQYEGVRDLDLAIKLGTTLNVDINSLQARYPARSALVRAIQETIEEG